MASRMLRALWRSRSGLQAAASSPSSTWQQQQQRGRPWVPSACQIAEACSGGFVRCSFPGSSKAPLHGWQQSRGVSASACRMSSDITEGGQPGNVESQQQSEAAPPEEVIEKPKRMRKKEKYGTYQHDIEDELEDFPEVDSHIYNARGMVEEWMGHKTLMGMLSDDALREGEVEIGRTPEQEDGPELRWETRMILGPGGNAWHPANRKVKVSVTVSHLELSSLAKERLLVMVGKRYHPGRDELTIISERFRDREENRKDVLRTLIELIKEAVKADELAAAA